MKTLIMVMAHAGAQATFIRNLHYWRVHGQDVMVSCPWNAAVETDLPILTIGANTHNGAAVNHKVKQIFKFMEKLSYDRYQFNEYDSLCLPNCAQPSLLHPTMPVLDQDTLWGNKFVNNGEVRFKGSCYFHPPITMSRAVLKTVNQVLLSIPDDAEHGFWDRMLGLACDVGNIKNSGYEKLGFARNTIEGGDLALAREARAAGAVYFHGVKSQAVLEAIR